MPDRRRQLERILDELRDANALDTLEYLHRTALDAETLAVCTHFVRCDTSHDIALLLDSRHRILAACPGWCELHSLDSCAECVGRCLWDIDQGERTERRRRLLEVATMSGETICTREPEAFGRGEFRFVVHPLESQHGGLLAVFVLGTLHRQPRRFYELAPNGQWQVVR